MRRAARPSRVVPGLLLSLVLALSVSGCTGTPDPAPTSAPAPTGEATAPPTAVPTSTSPTTAALTPGAPCDPAEGNPDCTDATGDETFRYVEGYADCVADFAEIGADEAYGLCTDLDGDGVFGYPTQ